MGTYVKITEQEMDDRLKTSKGWVKETCGYEYVYSYVNPTIPSVMIKIMSSVNTGTGEGRNKGSDAIRVFAVKIDKDGKVVRGYIKKQRVNRTTNWKDNLIRAYKIVWSQVCVRARRENLIINPEQ
jgi:hypothetical protein